MEEKVKKYCCQICKQTFDSDSVRLQYWLKGFYDSFGMWKKIPGYCCDCVNKLASQLSIKIEDVCTYLSVKNYTLSYVQDSPHRDEFILKCNDHPQNYPVRYVRKCREILEECLDFKDTILQLSEIARQYLESISKDMPQRKKGNLNELMKIR